MKLNAQKAGILSATDPGGHAQNTLNTPQNQGITDAGKETENVENPLTVAPVEPGFGTVDKEKVLPPGVETVPDTIEVVGTGVVSPSSTARSVSSQKRGTRPGVKPPPKGMGGFGLVGNWSRKPLPKLESYRQTQLSSMDQATLFYKTSVTGNTKELAETVYYNKLRADKIKAKKKQDAAKEANQSSGSSTSPQNSSATGPVEVLKYMMEFTLIHIVRGTIPTKEDIAELTLVLEPFLQMLSLLALGKLSKEQWPEGKEAINEKDLKKYIADVLTPALIKLRDEKEIDAYPIFMTLMNISLLKLKLLKMALSYEHLTAIVQNAVNLPNLTDAEKNQITVIKDYLTRNFVIR